MLLFFFFFFSSRRRHTRLQGDWSSDVCSSDLFTLETMIRDLGYALRMWRKNPLFAMAAITAIGLGIGVNAAVFTIVNGALSFDAGIEDVDRVVLASATDTLGRNVLSRSDPALRSFRSQVKTVVNLAAYRYDIVNVSDKSGLPERY